MNYMKPVSSAFVGADEPPVTESAVERAAARIGASPRAEPGMWKSPHWPRMTTAEMLEISRKLP
jgi:hypothetical protein